MQICSILQKESSDEPDLLEEKVKALEALHDLIEDIDNASDFVKIGGVISIILLTCLFPVALTSMRFFIGELFTLKKNCCKHAT